MPFQDLNIKTEYRTGKADFLKDFFIPVLSEACTYDRAVGFFSSSALIGLSEGLYNFVKRKGKIRVITSPRLSEDDFEAIIKGYEDRKSVVERALMRDLKTLTEIREDGKKERLNFIANLISNNILDIKIAFRNKGLYHEKMGILRDVDKRRIVFLGSLNETGSALFDNYEQIEVFSDWKDDDERINSKVNHFEEMWENKDPEIKVFRSDLLNKEIISRYKTSDNYIDQDLKDLEKLEQVVEENKQLPGLPDDIFLREYQIQAINEYIASDGRGIFDMATGTGKTFTALGAICCLREKNNGKLGVIVSVPLTYLVEQWAQDIKRFGITPIVAYSSSTTRNWPTILRLELNKHRRMGTFFCVVTTNQTFASSNFQQALIGFNSNNSNLCLVADEAHNFGAPEKIKLLSEKFKYRLALSATMERHNDPEGTDALLKFFGRRCIEYSLEKAIEEGFLTPYEYHPVFITLTEEESQAYANLSKKIRQSMRVDKDGTPSLTNQSEMLLIRRSRLVATAANKLNELKSRFDRGQFEDQNGILVYCGTSTHIPELDEFKSFSDTREELSQIDAITRVLNNCGISAVQYTSKIPTQERFHQIEEFVRGRVQALVAIKCLDEGVSINNIKYAFILASTTNPKEYIQRRGRVLRQFFKKDKAIIYDFITLPTKPGDGQVVSDVFKSLAENELRRFYEFKKLALNPYEYQKEYTDIIWDYKLNPDKIKSGGADA